MKQRPSPQEIQDYLQGLNRLQRSWSGSKESAIARQKGMNNYFKWFKDHDIAISEHPQSHVWRLNEKLEEREVL